MINYGYLDDLVSCRPKLILKRGKGFYILSFHAVGYGPFTLQYHTQYYTIIYYTKLTSIIFPQTGPSGNGAGDVEDGDCMVITEMEKFRLEIACMCCVATIFYASLVPSPTLRRGTGTGNEANFMPGLSDH